ncbi:MAG: hypothetical protein JWQ76_5873 [Ramlibacter sp.]|jgi:hypothetical protein|nr:hypothetical protein [Ramlibacter sp.]
MDTPDAIQSDDDAVVIPDHLRELLRATAERMLEDACDMAFAADARDAAIAAVHLIDAFEHESVTRGVVLALIPGSIEWEEPVKMPHTLEGVEQYLSQLDLARELIELRERLGGQPPEPTNVI